METRKFYNLQSLSGSQQTMRSTMYNRNNNTNTFTLGKEWKLGKFDDTTVCLYLGLGNDLNSHGLVLELALLAPGRAGVTKMPSTHFHPKLVLGSEVFAVAEALVQRLLHLRSALLGDRALLGLPPVAQPLRQRRFYVLRRGRRREPPLEEPPGGRRPRRRRRNSRRQWARGHSVRVRAGPGTRVRRTSRCVLDAEDAVTSPGGRHRRQRPYAGVGRGPGDSGRGRGARLILDRPISLAVALPHRKTPSPRPCSGTTGSRAESKVHTSDGQWPI